MASKKRVKFNFKRGDTFWLDLRVRDTNNTTAEELLAAKVQAQADLDAAIEADVGVVEAQAAFDAAVTTSHTHPNLTELNKIAEDADGAVTYSGKTLVTTGSINW